MLALHAAHLHPGKVARLVLVGATPSFVQRDGWPNGMAAEALAQFTQAVNTDPGNALKRFIALFNQGDVNSLALARGLTRALGRDALPAVLTLIAGLVLLRDTDLRPLAAEVRQPTLLLHGALDPLMPLAAARWLADTMPQAHLDVLPEAAHAPFMSDAPDCAALITAFMA
jgi:pimeloyl-[acyl-carrier protein] methyl ester esterase